MKMVLRGVVVLLVAIAVLAVILGNGWKVRATVAEKRYSVDSALFELRRQQLEDSIARLNRAGDSLKAGWAISREAADAGLSTIRQFIASLPAPQRDSAERAIVAVEEDRAQCSLVVLNCEARVGAERSGRLEALARLRSADSLRADAERRARPNFFRDIWRARAVVLPAFATTAVCLAR